MGGHWYVVPFQVQNRILFTLDLLPSRHDQTKSQGNSDAKAMPNAACVHSVPQHFLHTWLRLLREVDCVG